MVNISSHKIHVERMHWLRALATETPTGECVDWPWTLGTKGYPKEMGSGGRKRRVTHVLLELCGRPRPTPAHGVLHSCDRPPCLAPWHLRWGTNPENVEDRTTRDRQARGEQNGRAKLTRAEADQIRAAVAAGASQNSQARTYGIDRTTVRQIVRNEIWVEAAR